MRKFGLILVLASLGALAAAGGTAGASTAGAPDLGTDSGLGVLAALGCGMFGRALLAGAVVPGVIAGAIATCGYMFWDGLTHDR